MNDGVSMHTVCTVCGMIVRKIRANRVSARWVCKGKCTIHAIREKMAKGEGDGKRDM
jgi:hypothetical protein